MTSFFKIKISALKWFVKFLDMKLLILTYYYMQTQLRPSNMSVKKDHKGALQTE